MDFLGDVNVASALDVVFFMREIMETNQKLRGAVLERLLDSFYQIRAARVCSCALWIIGEYCTSSSDIDSVFEVCVYELHVTPAATLLTHRQSSTNQRIISGLTMHIMRSYVSTSYSMAFCSYIFQSRN